jgi:hypothetical protein
MILEVQRKINKGAISHPAINQDHISPSGGISMVDIDFHSMHIFPLRKLGLLLNREHVQVYAIIQDH